MTWAQPAAWVLAGAVLLPLIAHLWSRRTPRALPFPTLRFLRAAMPVSRRLRTVQDWPLLLLRLAIVVLAVGAAAGPTLATRARTARWQARLHRVIVVQPSVEARVAGEVARLAQDTSSATVVRTGSWDERLREARRQATDFARRQRTEMVVLWDGTHTSLSARDVAEWPRAAGLRLQPSDGARPAPPAFDQHATTRPSLEVVAARVDARIRTSLLGSLQLLVPATSARAVVIHWPGAPVRVPGSMPAVDDDLRAALAQLAGDARVRESATRSIRDTRATVAPLPAAARVLARGIDGVPLLYGWADGERLVLVLDAEPTSPLAVWAAVAALDASASPDAWARASATDAWTAAELASASRDAATPAPSALPGGLDTRATWGIVLALVLIEQWWRARRAGNDVAGAPGEPAGEVHDAA